MIEFGSNKIHDALMRTIGHYWILEKTARIHVESFIDKREFLPSEIAGDVYQVITKQYSVYRKNEIPPESFKCVLIHPPSYILSLCDNGYIGFVGKCFVNSDYYYDQLFDKMKNVNLIKKHLIRDMFYEILRKDKA